MQKRFFITLLTLISLELLTAQSTVLHKASERGRFENKWLTARYSFSFNNYLDTFKLGFGALLVLNDDIVAPGKGFGKHPHENMEIVTIPLKGAIRHKDNKGHTGVLGFGEVQVMSAGTGIRHSEYNNSKTDTLKSLQIWIRTDSIGHKPRYAQKKYDPQSFKNTFYTMVTPNDSSKLYIHQNASLSMGVFDHQQIAAYKKINTANILYVFVIEGTASYDGIELGKRDAIGIFDGVEAIKLAIRPNSQILIIEVPSK